MKENGLERFSGQNESLHRQHSCADVPHPGKVWVKMFSYLEPQPLWRQCNIGGTRPTYVSPHSKVRYRARGHRQEQPVPGQSVKVMLCKGKLWCYCVFKRTTACIPWKTDCEAAVSLRGQSGLRTHTASAEPQAAPWPKQPEHYLWSSEKIERPSVSRMCWATTYITSTRLFFRKKFFSRLFFLATSSSRESSIF